MWPIKSDEIQPLVIKFQPIKSFNLFKSKTRLNTSLPLEH